MAKYCKYCGKELKNQETCNCKTEKKEELKKATETIKEEVSISSKKYWNTLGKISKNIFIKPKETIEEFIDQEDTPLTMILLIATSLIIGICTVSFLKGIYSNLITSLNTFDNLYQPQIINNVWNISYLKILLCVSLGMFLGYILLAIIIDLGFEKISQIKLSFKKVLGTIAISALEPTFLCIIGAFLTIISYKLAIIIILYALLLYIINLYQSLKYAGKVSSTHYNHLFSILMLLFLFLAIYLIPNLFL